MTRSERTVLVAGVIGQGLIAAIIVLALATLGGCATLKTCTKPVEGQAIQDGAAVLTCVAMQGKPLAQCEEAQLSVEAGQITADALVCAELAVVSAANGTHTAGK